MEDMLSCGKATDNDALFVDCKDSLLRFTQDTTGDDSLCLIDLCAILQELDACLWNIDNVGSLLRFAGGDPAGQIDVNDFVKWLFSDNEAACAEAATVGQVSWFTQVPLPARYKVRRARVELTEHRAITAEQVNQLVQFVQSVLPNADIPDDTAKECIDWELINMYNICQFFVMPMTAPFRCSFVELVAESEQPPSWFVSHWWGTPFKQTHALLNFHAVQRQLPETTAYWICTFANNQHDLSELSGSLRDTPFVKAILTHNCMGTLTLLDNQVTPFERIWCVLENFVSTTWAREEAKSTPHLMDIAAWLPEGSGRYGGKSVPAKPTLRLDLGSGNMKIQVHDQSGSGGAFPLSVSIKGSRISLAKANSSREQDKRRILHLIAGTPEDEWDSKEPPDDCDAYDKLDAAARQLFAGGAFYGASQRGDLRLLSQLVAKFPKDINERYNGATAAYIAAWKNKSKALEFLLRSRADPNKQKEEGASPVLIATQSGHTGIVKQLLLAAADPNLAREDGLAPIHMAAQQCHPDILQALVEFRASVDACDKGGRTPLHVAVMKADVTCISILLEQKADPNSTSNKGFTPYRLAQQTLRVDETAVSDSPQQEVLSALLEAKADPLQASSPKLDENSPAFRRGFAQTFSDRSLSQSLQSCSSQRQFTAMGTRSMNQSSRSVDNWISNDGLTDMPSPESPFRPRVLFEDTTFGTFQVLFGNTRRWLESDEELPEHESRSAGPNVTWLEWTMELRFPQPEHAAYVNKVAYTLHPSFAVPVEVASAPPFAITRKGWGSFVVKAEVHLLDGQVRQLKHRLRFDDAEYFRPLELPTPATASATFPE